MTYNRVTDPGQTAPAVAIRTNGCTQIVVRRVTFTGNSSLSVDCAAAGTRRIVVAEAIALVE